MREAKRTACVACGVTLKTQKKKKNKRSYFFIGEEFYFQVNFPIIRVFLPFQKEKKRKRVMMK
jgi:hypothetical protein